MAVTEPTILFIGALATLATIGMFLNYADRWTELLVTFAAAILWAVLGMSSFNVIVNDSAAVIITEALTPLVYLGFGFAGIIALYGLHDLVVGVGEEVSEGDIDLFG